MIQTPAQTEVTAASHSVVSEPDQSAGTMHANQIPAKKYNAFLLIDCYSQIKLMNNANQYSRLPLPKIESPFLSN